MDDDRARWQSWKEETFGSEYMIWHDGLPIGAVTRLEGAAREAAIRMLLVGVALGDGHAAEALGHLAEGSVAEVLRGRLAAATEGSERVRLALALHRLAPDPALAGVLAEVLHGPAHWGVRIDAAIGLRELPAEVVTETLLRAVEDEDYLVRYHAATSWLVAHGIRPPGVGEHEGIFADIRGPPGDAPVTDAHRAGFARAAAALRALIA